MGGVVVGAAVWPLIRATGPTADVEQPGMRVAVGHIEPGTQISLLFHNSPVFVRRRTRDEINAARNTQLEDLPDTLARNPSNPDATALDVHRTIPPFSGEDRGEWLVIIGICTHLGCVPLGDRAGDFGGWFCPCHGAHFDQAGRIRLGPALENMAVPVAEFVDDGVLELRGLGRFARQWGSL